MGYVPMSIKKAIDDIEAKSIVLPALQRDYVWDEVRICELFDSLMKGYPIGSLLFWRVEGEDAATYSFHEFVKDVDCIEKNNRGNKVDLSQKSVVAVLDGQQRLTSIYLSLMGTYRSKIKTDRKINGDFPKRVLALNLLKEVKSNRDIYEFAFLNEKEIMFKDNEHAWFKVSEIMNPKFKREEIYHYLANMKITKDIEVLGKAMVMVTRLYNLIFDEENISYYTAEKTDLSEAVEIFERVNNNGKTLSGTDLILSMSSAGSKSDMHEKINDAIIQVTNATSSESGFVPDRNTILTSMLMAVGADKISTTCKENYEKNSIDRIISEWDDVIDAMCVAARFVELLGFDGNKVSKSSMQAVIYYFYNRANVVEDAKNYFDSNKSDAQKDKLNITDWLLRTQIKPIFNYGTVTTLKNIRDCMKNAMVGADKNQFPLGALVDRLTNDKSIVITMDDVNDIVSWKYGDSRIKPLLKLIQNESTIDNWDVDHLWPQAKMSTEAKIRKATNDIVLSDEQIEFYKSRYNLLPNLQLLRRIPNAEKNNEKFDVWLEKTYEGKSQERNNYLINNCIPMDISYEYGNFEKMYKEREKLIYQKIVSIFSVQK